jgi:hypothetical protein
LAILSADFADYADFFVVFGGIFGRVSAFFCVFFLTGSQDKLSIGYWFFFFDLVGFGFILVGGVSG